MNVRSLILTTVVSATLVLPAAAEKISLTALSDFLNELTTAKSKFTQINPDGTIATGTLYIHRPGRMRFEYDPPDSALVLAGGGTVAIFDRKSNEPPQQFPLKRTPLSVILRRNVDLSTANMITAHTANEVTTTVTAQDPEHPENGHIDLKFTDHPIELRQWIVTDESGNQTTVILADIERDLDINGVLFSVPIEVQKSKREP